MKCMTAEKIIKEKSMYNNDNFLKEGLLNYQEPCMRYLKLSETDYFLSCFAYLKSKNRSLVTYLV